MTNPRTAVTRNRGLKINQSIQLEIWEKKENVSKHMNRRVNNERRGSQPGPMYAGRLNKVNVTTRM
jgi:hypothetical protein